MRNLLLALTTGFIAGHLATVYRDLKFKRITELEHQVDQLLIHAPEATAHEIKQGLKPSQKRHYERVIT